MISKDPRTCALWFDAIGVREPIEVPGNDTANSDVPFKSINCFKSAKLYFEPGLQHFMEVLDMPPELVLINSLFGVFKPLYWNVGE